MPSMEKLMKRKDDLFSFSQTAKRLAAHLNQLQIMGTRPNMIELERLIKSIEEFD